ncbi:hypothetical protein DFH06DRAFT_1148313 [Mycena polygramma]|nr:hypothetical protein DFH06DRAFT_1148313 [Mycena polygramma]
MGAIEHTGKKPLGVEVQYLTYEEVAAVASMSANLMWSGKELVTFWNLGIKDRLRQAKNYSEPGNSGTLRVQVRSSCHITHHLLQESKISKGFVKGIGRDAVAGPSVLMDFGTTPMFPYDASV